VAQQMKLKMWCSVIALVSHYIFLCAFFWMLLEGVQLYLMLVRIFKLDKSPITKFCCIAYGTPFVIVLVSKLVDFYALDSKGYGTNEQ
jgi:adhesion G protein-coupled receptor L1